MTRLRNKLSFKQILTFFNILSRFQIQLQCFVICRYIVDCVKIKRNLTGRTERRNDIHNRPLFTYYGYAKLYKNGKIFRTPFHRNNYIPDNSASMVMIVHTSKSRQCFSVH